MRAKSASRPSVHTKEICGGKQVTKYQREQVSKTTKESEKMYRSIRPCLLPVLNVHDELEQITAFAQFQNKVQFIFFLKCLVQFDNVWMVEHFHNIDFISQRI